MLDGWAVRPLSELDDSSLVSAATAGNREAFDVLVEAAIGGPFIRSAIAS
jgi:hypothetical protein